MNGTQAEKAIWIPQAVAVALLMWALYPENPYGYYVFLRMVCCGTFAFLAFIAFDRTQQAWAWIFGLTAVVYNPFIRIHLDRETWSWINVGTIAVAVVSILTLNPAMATTFKREFLGSEESIENRAGKEFLLGVVVIGILSLFVAIVILIDSR